MEADLVAEVARTLRRAGKTQKGFALSKGVSPQAVNPYFTGSKALLTDTAIELFEYLGVRVRLEPVEKGD